MAEAATSATTADVRKVRRRHTGACFPFFIPRPSSLQDEGENRNRNLRRLNPNNGRVQLARASGMR